MNSSKRTVTINRIFNVPIENVWNAWTQPEHLIKWWGPKGMTTKIIEHNCTINRKWKYAMLTPEGQKFIAQGEFTEIIEFKSIKSLASFKPMTDGVEIQSLFEIEGNKTQFTFHIIHPTEKIKMHQENMGLVKGWNSTFDRLSEFLLELNSQNK